MQELGEKGSVHRTLPFRWVRTLYCTKKKKPPDWVADIPIYGSSSTALQAASVDPWTLPRAKKHVAGMFFTLPSARPPSSSLISYQKEKPHRMVWFSFLVDDIGLEEGGDGIAVVKKCPANTFLARGRVHGAADAARRAVDDDP